jgi:hypothetical protein
MPPAPMHPVVSPGDPMHEFFPGCPGPHPADQEAAFAGWLCPYSALGDLIGPFSIRVTLYGIDDEGRLHELDDEDVVITRVPGTDCGIWSEIRFSAARFDAGKKYIVVAVAPGGIPPISIGVTGIATFAAKRG